MKPAVVAIVYAAVLMGAGVYAWSSAPDPSKATTGLLIPGVCAAVMAVIAVVIALVRRNGKATGAAVRTAIVVTAVFAAAFSVRAVSVTMAESLYQSALAEYDAASGAGSVEPGEEARREFLASKGAGDHSKAYLRNTLWIMVISSVLAAIGFASTMKAAPRAG